MNNAKRAVTIRRVTAEKPVTRASDRLGSDYTAKPVFEPDATASVQSVAGKRPRVVIIVKYLIKKYLYTASVFIMSRIRNKFPGLKY